VPVSLARQENAKRRRSDQQDLLGGFYVNVTKRLRDLDDRAVQTGDPMTLRAAAVIALLLSAVSLVLVWGDSPAATVLLFASIAALSGALGRDRQRR
jgi:hypothetical protein